LNPHFLSRQFSVYCTWNILLCHFSFHFKINIWSSYLFLRKQVVYLDDIWRNHAKNLHWFLLSGVLSIKHNINSVRLSFCWVCELSSLCSLGLERMSVKLSALPQQKNLSLFLAFIAMFQLCTKIIFGGTLFGHLPMA